MIPFIIEAVNYFFTGFINSSPSSSCFNLYVYLCQNLRLKPKVSQEDSSASEKGIFQGALNIYPHPKVNRESH